MSKHQRIAIAVNLTVKCVTPFVSKATPLLPAVAAGVREHQDLGIINETGYRHWKFEN